MFYSSKGYRLTLPPGPWQVSTDGRADLELARNGLRAGILAHATCEGKPPGRPLRILARHLTVGLEERKLLEREEVTVRGHSGIRVVVEGQLDGTAVTAEAFVLKGEGCVYDLVYVASPGDFAAGRAEFRELVESFAGP